MFFQYIFSATVLIARQIFLSFSLFLSLSLPTVKYFMCAFHLSIHSNTHLWLSFNVLILISSLFSNISKFPVWFLVIILQVIKCFLLFLNNILDPKFFIVFLFFYILVFKTLFFIEFSLDSWFYRAISVQILSFLYCYIRAPVQFILLILSLPSHSHTRIFFVFHLLYTFFPLQSSRIIPKLSSSSSSSLFFPLPSSSVRNTFSCFQYSKIREKKYKKRTKKKAGIIGTYSGSCSMFRVSQNLFSLLFLFFFSLSPSSPFWWFYFCLFFSLSLSLSRFREYTRNSILELLCCCFFLMRCCCMDYDYTGFFEANEQKQSDKLLSLSLSLYFSFFSLFFGHIFGDGEPF